MYRSRMHKIFGNLLTGDMNQNNGNGFAGAAIPAGEYKDMYTKMLDASQIFCIDYNSISYEDSIVLHDTALEWGRNGIFRLPYEGVVFELFNEQGKASDITFAVQSGDHIVFNTINDLWDRNATVVFPMIGVIDLKMAFGIHPSD